MKKLIFILFYNLIQIPLFSQDILRELSTPSNKSGIITVHQNESLKNLFNNSILQNKAMQGKIQGYRIQLFSDYKSSSRERALKLRSEFIALFPDYDPTRIYNDFEPPFIKVRVGDYRDENSALIDYKRFVKAFPDCYIVKTPIFYPPIE